MPQFIRSRSVSATASTVLRRASWLAFSALARSMAARESSRRCRLSPAFAPLSSPSKVRRIDMLSQLLGYLGIAGEHRTQHLQHRTEPGLEVAPVVDRLAGDRLAYLFRARRQHGAIRFIEAQTVFVERKPKVTEQAPHFAFGVSDE